MSTDAAYFRLGMRIFAELSGMIAIPCVLAALLGKWLDARYDTSPRYMLILLALAFALTIYVIASKAKSYSAAFNKLLNEK